MNDDWQHGCIKRDGWIVTWDHRENTGQLTYTCRDEDGLTRLVARQDDGWRIAPEGFTTVDNEVLLDSLVRTTLVEDEGWRELAAILEEAAA